MLLYLLKITIAWALFLLLFGMLYKNSGKFAANRAYLLLSLAAGLLLPFIVLPAGLQPAVMVTQAPMHTVLYAAPELAVSAPAAGTHTGVTAPHSIGWWQIWRIVYYAGAMLLLLKFLLESIQIARSVKRKPHRAINGQMVIVTGGDHAPYSFMGHIFMSDPGRYNSTELTYIIHHEAAHNLKKHWLDLLLLQMVCIVCWFHPLVWYYRYLLKLQHEYEADELAAGENRYEYGHFLLRLALLRGVPSIAHSFYFSPIKNRILMLTKKQSRKVRTWMYFLVVPVITGCTFLMAKAADKKQHTTGNVTTYNGNTFTWRDADSLVYDAKHGRMVPVSAYVPRIKTIVSMNNEPVYANEKLAAHAKFGDAPAMVYMDYVRKEYLKRCTNSQDSMTYVNISDLVISKEGKIVYYRVSYSRAYLREAQNIKELNPFPEKDLVLNGIIDDIIARSPGWQPALVNGRPVNSVISFGGC